MEEGALKEVRGVVRGRRNGRQLVIWVAEIRGSCAYDGHSTRKGTQLVRAFRTKMSFQLRAATLSPTAITAPIN